MVTVNNSDYYNNIPAGSDLYTQKEILERYRSRVQQMEAEQRETSRKKIRLYQSMGLLAGMAVAILLC